MHPILNYVKFRTNYEPDVVHKMAPYTTQGSGLATNSTWYVAEREGFEPSVPILIGTHDFQSCPFSRSGISPTRFILSLSQLRPRSNNSELSAFAEREGCARSLRSLRLPRLWRGRRTLGPDFNRNTRFPIVPLQPLGHLSGSI